MGRNEENLRRSLVLPLRPLLPSPTLTPQGGAPPGSRDILARPQERFWEVTQKYKFQTQDLLTRRLSTFRTQTPTRLAVSPSGQFLIIICYLNLAAAFHAHCVERPGEVTGRWQRTKCVHSLLHSVVAVGGDRGCYALVR